MQALLLKEGGYASAPSLSGTLTSLDPFLELAEIAVPAPPSGHVLIKVRMASINPSDVAFIQGVYGIPRTAGAPAGFEAVGDVVASGGGEWADKLVGKRVSFIAGGSGAWAGYAIASAAACSPLDPRVRDEDGAAMIVNPMTAWAMFDIVRKEGEKAFVLSAGASQLCKLMTVLAKEEGYRAISLVRRDEHVDRLMELGAAHAVNTEAPDAMDRLKAIFREEKPRIFLDALSGPVAASVFAAMGRKSRWIIYGGLDPRPAPVPAVGDFVFKLKHIEGFWLTDWLQSATQAQRVEASAAVQQRFMSGAWRTDVARNVSLSEAHSLLPGLLSAANHGKVMLVP
jgi:NADPH:quinone reductase-like Zn-dependent oxidoreductase